MKITAVTPEELEQHYLNLKFDIPTNRPHVAINMVSSFDGVINVVDAQTHKASEKGLGTKTDQRVMKLLRSHVDATLNGSATLALSGCSSDIEDKSLEDIRTARGQKPNPIACVLSFDGSDLVFDKDSQEASFFYSEDFDRILFTTTKCPSEIQEKIKATGTHLEVISEGEDKVVEILKIMKEKYQINFLLCEGGPTINGSLLKNNLVDDFFLTFAPHLVGGGKHPVELKEPLTFGNLVELEPVSNLFLEDTGESFLHYRILSLRTK